MDMHFLLRYFFGYPRPGHIAMDSLDCATGSGPLALLLQREYADFSVGAIRPAQTKKAPYGAFLLKLGGDAGIRTLDPGFAQMHP